MATIREDLEGVAVAVVNGDVLILKAGDEVPEGVTVGDHLLAPSDEQPEQPDEEQAGDEQPEQAPAPKRSRASK